MRNFLRLPVIGVAMAAVVGMSGAGNAADVYAKGGSLKDEPAAYGPGTNRAGLYLGGSVGRGWGEISDVWTDSYPDGPIFITTVGERSDEVSGAVYGAHLGYNFQRGDIVFGAEIGINGAAMDSSTFNDNVRHDLNWYATAVGRLGYAHDNFLFYGFGGIAWGNIETELPAWRFKDSATYVGWTAGVGVEYALSRHLSLRLEYAHVNLGDNTSYSRAETYPAYSWTDTIDTDLVFDVIKVGASYRFGGGDDALK
jgi:outer membrane immunogenic protein